MPSESWQLGLLDFIPPAVADGLRGLRQWCLFPKYRKILSRNLVWKDRYAGKRVYVIGNGPSLAAVDRRLLAGEYVVVMNNFHKAEWKDEVRPVAHCFGEPPTSPSWLDPSELFNETDSESYWVIASAHGLVGALKQGKHVNCMMPGIEPRIWGRRRLKLDKVTLGFQTTAQLAIQVALYMGFTDIRLLGFDHDWLASPQYSKHFYSDEPDPEDRLGILKYYELIRYSLRIWECYYALRTAAEAHGAKIVNMTDGSYLDVFQRCKGVPVPVTTHDDANAVKAQIGQR